MLGKLYTCEQVAARYGVQTRTVWDWVRSGKLPAINTTGPKNSGKRYRIDEDDLKAFEESSKTTCAAI